MVCGKCLPRCTVAKTVSKNGPWLCSREDLTGLRARNVSAERRNFPWRTPSPTGWFVPSWTPFGNVECRNRRARSAAFLQNLIVETHLSSFDIFDLFYVETRDRELQVIPFKYGDFMEPIRTSSNTMRFVRDFLKIFASVSVLLCHTVQMVFNQFCTSVALL